MVWVLMGLADNDLWDVLVRRFLSQAQSILSC